MKLARYNKLIKNIQVQFTVKYIIIFMANRTRHYLFNKEAILAKNIWNECNISLISCDSVRLYESYCTIIFLT